MHITDEIVLDIIKNIEKDSHEKNMDFFCVSRDIFQARVDSFVTRTKKYLESAIMVKSGIIPSIITGILIKIILEVLILIQIILINLLS